MIYTRWCQHSSGTFLTRQLLTILLIAKAMPHQICKAVGSICRAQQTKPVKIFYLKGNFMIEKLACENPEICNYFWNLAEEQMSGKETFL